MRSSILVGMLSLALPLCVAVYGLMTPEITYHHEVRIEKPIMPVFMELMDVNNLPSWVRNLEKVEAKRSSALQIPGMPAQSYNLTYRKGTMSKTFKMRIRDVEVFKRVNVLLSADDFEVECTTHIEADGDATVLKIDMAGRGHTVLTRIMVPFSKWRLASETEENFANFKKLVEEGQDG